jgi:hypothetical protein
VGALAALLWKPHPEERVSVDGFDPLFSIDPNNGSRNASV